jgi:hypothetical protein
VPVCDATEPHVQTAMISEFDGAVTLVVNVRVVAVVLEATGVPRLVGVPIDLAEVAQVRPTTWHPRHQRLTIDAEVRARIRRKRGPR